MYADRYCIWDLMRFAAVTYGANLRAEFRFGGGDDRMTGQGEEVEWVS